MFRKQNEAIASKQEMVPQTAEGCDIPNRESVDTQTSARFMKAMWKSPS